MIILAITQFATSLTRLESSIVELDLSDCGIGTKSLNILARSFQAAGRIADSLRALRLRNNSLKDDLAVRFRATLVSNE